MLQRCLVCFFFFSSRRRHTRCALVTGVQTCALPIFHNIWYADEIPAQPEPYENEDWHKGNKTWTVKYTLYTIVRAGREILARVKGLEKSVAAVQSPTVDLDALATQIVAQLGDDLAEVIADKLAARHRS